MAKKNANARNHIGKRGEAIATKDLMNFCGNSMPYFDPHFLGDKCPTYDFLVELLDAAPHDPYFFAQVKSTKQPVNGKARLNVSLSLADVQKMVNSPIPTYLIGVDEPNARSYIVSIHAPSNRPISSIPVNYPLDCTNLKLLWNEVFVYWSTLANQKPQKTSRFKR